MTDLPPPGGLPAQPRWATPAAPSAPQPGPPGYGQPPPPGHGAPPGAGPQYGPSAYAPAGTPSWGPPAARGAALGGLRTALIALLALSSVAALVAAYQLFQRASLVDDLASDIFSLSFSDVQDADSAVSGSVGFLALAVLATGIVWLIWQARHASNAVLVGQREGLAPGWAIGGWFIPLGNLVLPGVQLRQSSAASDPSAGPGRPGTAEPLVIPWAITLGVGWVLFVGARASRPSDEEIFLGDKTIDDFARADRITGVASLVLVAAALLAIAMVARLTSRQEAKLAGALPPPTAQPYSPSTQPYASPAQPWHSQPSYPQPGAYPPPQPQQPTYPPPQPQQPSYPPPQPQQPTYPPPQPPAPSDPPPQPQPPSYPPPPMYPPPPQQ